MDSKGECDPLEPDEMRELYKQLRERVKQLRMREFFQEPNMFDDEDWM
jgi:hypothetical protein